jgi:predicted nicotinamide N-methyase
MSPLRFRYQTIEFGDTDIHVRTLRDRQQFSDDAGAAARLGISSAAWPLFGVIWPSGELLARLMFRYDVQGKKILEVGCGIGLASLVLNHRTADLTATDHHPEVGRFLSGNAALNEDPEIRFVRAAWSDSDTGLGEFDLIIGSDVLYENEHPEQLAGFIDDHAKLHCDVIIVDPGRRQQGRFRKQMARRGYTYCEIQSNEKERLSQPFVGRIMKYRK